MSNPEYTRLSPSTLLCPTPVVLVSSADPKQPEKPDMVTVAWAGTVNSEPPMVSVSLRKERYSHGLIESSGEFVVNLPDEAMCKAVDFCGVRSGRDTDKSRETGLRYIPAENLSVAPAVDGAPVSLSCRVKQVIPLGSHDMFLGEVVAVRVRKDLVDEKGSLHLEKAHLIVYSHGLYQTLGDVMGFFGWSVAREEVRKKRMAQYR
jgi:flavin reductase (DIM6/NTAB) family NADH-FMN oxidoreductase RutF